MNRHKTPVLLAWSLACLTFLVMAVTLWLIWLIRGVELPGSYDPGSMAVSVASFAMVPLVGGMIAAKQPHNPYGWIWLNFGLAMSSLNFAVAYIIQGLIVSPGSLPLAQEMLLLANFSFLAGISALPFLLLLFPTGLLPSPRWKILVWVVVVAFVGSLVISWGIPGQTGFAPIDNPYGLEGQAGQAVELFSTILVTIIFAMVLPSALSLVVRYRRATGTVRQQLKWFAFGSAFFAAFLVSDFVIELPGIWESVKEMLAFSVLPVTVGIAILRYHLYDIDLIIRKTLVYGLLSAVLAVVYFGSVVLLQKIFSAATGQGSPVAVVLSTLLIAGLFQPIRRRIKDGIDRRFYRRKYDAARTLEAFAFTARDEVNLEMLTAELVRTVKETIQPQNISLWLKPPDPVSLERLLDSGDER